MPFGSVFWPSYGLSLLKSELRQRGLSARVEYFTIPFAEMLGQAFYSDIAGGVKPTTSELTGEWIFAEALFGPRDPEPYLRQILRERTLVSGTEWVSTLTPAFIDRVVRARGEVEGFLDRCLERVLEAKPALVGFTSVFQQHVASLALAKRIREALPDVFIVFGGANCEGVMGAETLRQFPFLDAVVSGEADVVFPELVRQVLETGQARELPGVRTAESTGREFASGRFESAPMVRDLDELPYPDYDDFFTRFSASRFHREWQPRIFFETSRGCWWGERHHCTFCGLNGTGMAYRSKSADRALREISWLAEKHPGSGIDLVDNILDLAYLNDFLPRLAALGLNLDLFYETKSNLKKEQVRTLARSGVRTIQPGIESLSDPILRLMRKGVTALQNIQLLKWCKELSVEPSWNLLWGFPGEPPEEYAAMAELVPSLTHLPPPSGIGGLRLDRFSPNFFDAEEYGFTGVAPLSSYGHVYPLSEEALSNLAYFFSHRHSPCDARSYVRPLLDRLRRWKKAARESDLFSVDVSGQLLIWDLRPGSREPLVVLRGLDRALYLACDEAQGLVSLARRLSRLHDPPERGAIAIERSLENLAARRLLVTRGSCYLALAIPLGDYVPSPAVTRRFYETARSLGRSTRKGIVVRLGELVAKVERRSSTRPATKSSSRRLTGERFRLSDEGQLVIS